MIRKLACIFTTLAIVIIGIWRIQLYLEERNRNYTITYKMKSDKSGYIACKTEGKYSPDYSSIKEIKIPDYYKKKPVVEVEGGSFKDMGSLESVTIGNNVKYIGNSAFANCANLKHVVLGVDVEEIGAHTFYYCANLRNIRFNDSLTTIGVGAFSYSSLEDVIIPDKVTLIRNEAFYNCKSLKTVTLGKNVESIGENCFANSNIEEIRINENLVTIKEGAFHSTKLKSFNFNSKMEEVSGFLYGCNQIEELVIPDNIKKIDDYSFQSMTGLKKITIGKNVESIGMFCFDRCVSLEEIVLPTSVKKIGKNAFVDCKKLKKVTMLGVEEIGEHAFYKLEALETVELGNSLKEIGESTFEDCTNLVNFNLPNSVTKMDFRAIYNIGIKEISIPRSMTTLGGGAFGGNTVEKIFVPNTVKVLEEIAFYTCNCPIYFEDGIELESINPYAYAEYKYEWLILPKNIKVLREHSMYALKDTNDIFYMGSESDWNNIDINLNAFDFTEATISYYSESEPLGEGNYWHFDSNNNPIKWN